MKAALLLVDLQNDFLARTGLVPNSEEIIRQTSVLLDGARALGLQVFHVHTRIHADGSNAMPHWRKNKQHACVENTPGAMPPPELAPKSGEIVISKRFFSGFENPDLDIELRKSQADTLIIAGIYLHGCVRATALDAYARGYCVVLASDATGSTEPLHAEITREYLNGRAAELIDVETILARFTPRQPSAPLPAALIAGRRIDTTSPEKTLSHANPADTREEIFRFAAADRAVVHNAVSNSHIAQRDWEQMPIKARANLLLNWRDGLLKEKGNWTAMTVHEVGKPLRDAQEEIQRALAYISSCIDTALTNNFAHPEFKVRYCPLGTIALITPWNNPIAIPVGKLIPALLYGNSIVWKPSPHASRIAEALLQSLIEAGLPPALVNLVFGEGETARYLMLDPGVSAVSLTGSIDAGTSASALCTLTRKPLQAELGGNNALIVLPGSNLDAAMEAFTRSAFSYSGQRCTAIRRFVVEKSLHGEFERKLTEAVASLRLGPPEDESTDIGPLISLRHQARVRQAILQAQAAGARILIGGDAPEGKEHGCWLQPALLTGACADSAIVRDETFGPVAVIQQAKDLVDAIRIANCVPHGLVAGLVGGDATDEARFLASIQAGIIKLGPGALPVHPDAPFGGWKASGIGLPEHGYWDREFYARPQVVYH